MVILSGMLILKDVSENLTNIWIRILVMILAVSDHMEYYSIIPLRKCLSAFTYLHQSLLHREKRIILLMEKNIHV